MRTYTFYKDEIEFRTDNLTAFCREHGLQRRHINEVLAGTRKQHHGFTLAGINVSPEAMLDDGVQVEQVLQMAEVAARSSGDPEYEALVLSRTAKIRRGEALRISQDDAGTITMLD